MQGTFDHSAYHDRYRERLMAIIDKKRKGETISVPEVEERRAPADLMAALEASLGEAVGRRKAARKRPARRAQDDGQVPQEGCSEEEEGRSQGRRRFVIDVAATLRGSARTHAPSRLVFVLQEVALWALLYPLYLLTREGAEGSQAAALRHAREIVAAERSLGIAIEHWLQQIATASPLTRAAFDAYYEWAFYPLLVVVVLWLALTRRELYCHTRRALVVALAVAAVFFLLFPAAPPRMLPGLGIHDTVGMHDHDVGSFHGISYNPYAAMPSLHVGWSLIAAAGVFRAVRNPWVRAAAIVHPLAMTVTTIATGNHYLLDCVAGAAIGLVALAATGARHPSEGQARRQVGVRAAAGVAGRHA